MLGIISMKSVKSWLYKNLKGHIDTLSETYSGRLSSAMERYSSLGPQTNISPPRNQRTKKSGYMVKLTHQLPLQPQFSPLIFPEQSPTDELISGGYNHILEEVMLNSRNSDQYHVNWYDHFVGVI